MPTPKKGPRLGGSPAHQRLMLANLASNLFEHGALTTTEAKARQLRPFAEKLITKAKRGDLHNRRQVLSVIRDKTVVHVLFTEIGPKFAERPGGYTRITKIGPRKGDNAPMAVIELVEEEFTPQARSATAAKAEAPVEEAATDESSAEETAADETVTEETVTEETAAEEASTEEPDAAEELADEQEAVAEQEPTGETVDAPADDAAAEESDETK